MAQVGRARVRESQSNVRREELIARLMPLFLEEGFAHLSLDDLARHAKCSKTTLYLIGGSKEQIVLAVIRAFFRRATDEIAARSTDDGPPPTRIGSYLRLISETLATASPTFFADLDAMPPAHEIYQNNTRIAAERVQQLVTAALGDESVVDAVFVGAVAGQVMNAIHRGEIEAATGLDDSAAYRALGNLIVAGVTTPRPL